MQLLVSFDVVRSRCRCAMKKVFSLSDNFAGGEKTALFRESKKFPLAERFSNFTQSRFLHTKTSLYVPFFAVHKKSPFSQTKRFSFAQTLRTVRKSCLFTYKKPFIHTNLSLLQSKVTLFYPPPPISTSLNLLSAKNAAVLLMFA